MTDDTEQPDDTPEVAPTSPEEQPDSATQPDPVVPVGDRPYLKFKYGKLHQGARTNFHRCILRDITTTPIGGVVPPQPDKIWNGLLLARYLWVSAAQRLRRAMIYNAKDTTWNTRLNCRPLTVSVTPGSYACGMIRICPFCYSRKAWRMFLVCCEAIQFGPRLGMPHRAITAAVRRSECVS